MHPRPRPGPLQRLYLPTATEAEVQLYVKRDDLYSPLPGSPLQGNKVRKLEPVLEAALTSRKQPILVSFGGAYSNHVAALATAGELYGLAAHLIIRGEEVSNPLLDFCAAAGARVERITRAEYRKKSDNEWLKRLRNRIAAEHNVRKEEVWIIPEGGTAERGVANVGKLYHEIVTDLRALPDVVAISAGTGGTAAGLLRAADRTTRVEIFPALKGNWMAEEIRKWLAPEHSTNWECIPGHHFGGYGKFPAEWVEPAGGLAKRAELGIAGLPPLEPVYTAKLFSGVLDRIAKGFYPPGTTIVLVHTGGIY